MNFLRNTLQLKRMHIDTQIEHVVYMLKGCSVYKSEGFESLSRVQVEVNGKKIIASLNIVSSALLKKGEAGLSESAWLLLGAKHGDIAHFSHPPTVHSMVYVRSKLFGNELNKASFVAILNDLISGLYSNIETAAFISACAARSLSLNEITDLTRAMIETGQQLHWQKEIVVDKHCVGGLPGNRTTPIVVAIVAAAGITIPKTSSRAITSPAGTADTMETLTKVDLDLQSIQEVVKKENGCFVWGGSVKLSPADDLLIRIERALDIDSDGQMIASVLSKKKAAGSTHVLIDMPVGKTAKVRSQEAAEKLKSYFEAVGSKLGLIVKVVITDGSQPVGRGIGPALEAMDVLSVLRNESDAPQDLKIRALQLAAEILELCGRAEKKDAYQLAEKILEEGLAYTKFTAICNAQGAFKTPGFAKFKYEVRSSESGSVSEIDNRKIARAAKLAGAPREPSAGILLKVRLGDKVAINDILYLVFSEAEGELNYALDYVKAQKEIIKIEA